MQNIYVFCLYKRKPLVSRKIPNCIEILVAYIKRQAFQCNLGVSYLKDRKEVVLVVGKK